MIKKNLSKLLSVICSTALVFSITIPVSAEDQAYTYDSTGDTAQAVPVVTEAERVSQFTVNLPKKIVFDGSVVDNTIDYNVKVNGEISSTEKVKVVPATESTITNGKLTLPVYTLQDKVEWTYDEIADGVTSATTEGTVTVNNLQSGQWTGVLEFIVSLDDGHNWATATCTEPRHCLGHDTDGDGVIDTECNTIWGKPLGHDTDDPTAFPYTCKRCGLTVYAIDTEEKLKQFRDMVNAGTTFVGCNVELTNDIALTEPWIPIGDVRTEQKVFQGTFNGNGYTISNLILPLNTITLDVSYSYGVFSVTKNAVIKNVKITGFTTAPFTYSSTAPGFKVGAIVGNAIDTKIENVQVVGNMNVSMTEGNPTSEPSYIGGIVGKTEGVCSLKNASFRGNINYTGRAYMGAGYVNVGGLVGGGLVPLTIKNSYVAGSITASNSWVVTQVRYDPFITGADNVITNCIYDTELSTLSLGVYATDSTAQGYSTADMQGTLALAYLNTGSGVWKQDLETTNNGYPILR